MNRKQILSAVSFSLVIAALCCCGNKAKQQNADNNTKKFALPTIPADIREPKDRAAWLLAHYWDSLDFGDTAQTHNRKFMEQTFVDFLSVFPLADSAAIDKGVAGLMNRAVSDTTCYYMLAELAEHYLYDPNSPMLCEEHYAHFLRTIIRNGNPDSDRMLRPQAHLATVMKNRPGSVAADFRYTDRKGNGNTLHGTKGDMTLLLFYDPDCEHCTEIMSRMKTDERLKGFVDNGRLTVLAVYAEGDRELWRRSLGDMPAEWLVAFDMSNIQERNLYVLRAMPTIYLLDKEKRVILKDVRPEALMNHLTERLYQPQP